jgi:hypothetical protein
MLLPEARTRESDPILYRSGARSRESGRPSQSSVGREREAPSEPIQLLLGARPRESGRPSLFSVAQECHERGLISSVRGFRSDAKRARPGAGRRHKVAEGIVDSRGGNALRRRGLAIRILEPRVLVADVSARAHRNPRGVRSGPIAQHLQNTNDPISRKRL